MWCTASENQVVESAFPEPYVGHGADPCPPSGTDPGNRVKRLGFAVDFFLTRTKIPRIVWSAAEEVKESQMPELLPYKAKTEEPPPAQKTMGMGHPPPGFGNLGGFQDSSDAA